MASARLGRTLLVEIALDPLSDCLLTISLAMIDSILISPHLASTASVDLRLV